MPDSILVKTILNKTKRRDPWFLDDYTINPFSGCSFNCLYCYIRGSKYGMNMEQKLSVKENALEVLEKQLKSRAKKNQYGIIVLSSATDPYLQFEKDLKLTRKILELILRYKFPVHIITKGDLVTRDFDLLEKINSEAILPEDLKLKHKVFITFSFCTVDDGIRKIFEPGATAITARLDALHNCIEAGFQSGVSLMPLIPYITDTAEHLEVMFRTMSSIGAKYIFPAGITLHGNGFADSRTLVMKAVEKNYPHLIDKYKKYFLQNDHMPGFYSSAFSKKMAELSIKYSLKNSLY